MAPHAIESILQPPQWPLGLSNFVTWCLMWDPKNRPTSRQAMDHEFFADAVDPLRPKSSSRLLGRKHSDLSFRSKEGVDSPLQTKPSWFRRSLIARDSAPAVPQHTEDALLAKQSRPPANKRATWTHGANPATIAPMPILPSIKPISPLPNAVNAQGTQASAGPLPLPPQVPTHQKHLKPKPAEVEQQTTQQQIDDKHRKIGRQLSVNSHGNHYAEAHRLEAERALNGNGSTSGLVSPPYQKESFFSHLRKRARRFSGRHGLASPGGDDVEANAAAVPWSNRSSIMVDSVIPEHQNDFSDLDNLLQSVRYSLDKSAADQQNKDGSRSNQSTLKRTHSVPRSSQSQENVAAAVTSQPAARNRKSIPQNFYDTPEEEDELLDEALRSANRAVRRLNQGKPSDAQKAGQRQPLTHVSSNPGVQGALTPSPSAKRNGVAFDPNTTTPTQPLNIQQRKQQEYAPPHWPTPPYEENEWASAAAASIYAAGRVYP
jgi:meiosis induction protein kinase IME2/SME1